MTGQSVRSLLAVIQAVEALLPKARVIYDENDNEIEYVETHKIRAALAAAVPTQPGDVCDWCKSQPACDGSRPTCPGPVAASVPAPTENGKP